MNILDKIVAQKKVELAQLYKELENNTNHPLHLQIHARNLSFQKALCENTNPSVIAEIKRRSPSRGNLAHIPSPETLALSYAEGGAAAISVLTDNNSFGGSLEDLKVVRNALDHAHYQIPILRKDFIIDLLQVKESAHAGAQAILLIASILQEELPLFIEESTRIGLEALVEVHTKEELQLALSSGAKIIGVNQRNLKTFEMHPNLFEELAPLFPSSIIRVAESGIFTREHSFHAASLGYHAVLVGETLVKSSNPLRRIRELSGKL